MLPQTEITLDVPQVTGEAAKPSPSAAYKFGNSSLSGSQVEQDYRESSEKLFNDTQPGWAVKKEQPLHRIVILLKAQGKSNREIAEIVGYTAAWVGQVLVQPWARLKLLDVINEAGKDPVYELLRGEVTNSVFKIIEVRDTADEKNVQLAAANSLLDRFLGKPTQRVESFDGGARNSDHLDPAKLDEELARVRGDVARLTGSTTTQPAPVSEAPKGTETETSPCKVSS